jgi:hypothetical protein
MTSFGLSEGYRTEIGFHLAAAEGLTPAPMKKGSITPQGFEALGEGSGIWGMQEFFSSI